MKFKKKPDTIDAIQWDGVNTQEIIEFAGSDNIDLREDQKGLWIMVQTRQGHFAMNINDWIVQEFTTQGFKHFSPVKPDYISENYEEA